MKYFLFVYLTMVSGLSLVAFAIYGFDKRRARSGGRRVAERRLHLLAWLGGWPGALLAQTTFRHKTQKPVFRIVCWLAAVLHLALIAGVIYLASR